MDEAPICWRCDQRLFRDVAGNKRADALVWPALDLIKGSLRLLASVLQHASFGKIRAHALATQIGGGGLRFARRIAGAKHNNRYDRRLG